MARDYDVQVFAALAMLWRDTISIYNFVDIWLDGPYYEGHPLTYFPDIHLCDWIRSIPNVDTIDEEGNTVQVTYEAELLKAMEPPAKTGNVTQEVQRLLISQPLGREEDPAEFVIRVGNRFHNALITVRSIIEIEDELYFTQPVEYGEGLIKSVARNNSNAEVVIEFTNSYGKLSNVKALRTTQGSVKRFKPTDTCFNKASIDIGARIIEWGTKGQDQ